MTFVTPKSRQIFVVGLLEKYSLANMCLIILTNYFARNMIPTIPVHNIWDLTRLHNFMNCELRSSTNLLFQKSGNSYCMCQNKFLQKIVFSVSVSRGKKLLEQLLCAFQSAWCMEFALKTQCLQFWSVVFVILSMHREYSSFLKY